MRKVLAVLVTRACVSVCLGEKRGGAALRGAEAGWARRERSARRTKRKERRRGVGPACGNQSWTVGKVSVEEGVIQEESQE